jgi:hypothetical protein
MSCRAPRTSGDIAVYLPKSLTACFELARHSEPLLNSIRVRDQKETARPGESMSARHTGSGHEPDRRTQGEEQGYSFAGIGNEPEVALERALRENWLELGSA